MIQEVVLNRAVEDHDPDMLVGLESVDDLLELPDHFRTHHVDRRVVDRDTPIGGRPPGQANLWKTVVRQNDLVHVLRSFQRPP